MSNTAGPQLLRQCIDAALADAGGLLDRVVRKARGSLMFRVDQTFDLTERREYEAAVLSLERYQPVMRERFTRALVKSFDEGGQEKKAKPLTTVSFGQLELMDEAQVQETVEMARAQQVVSGACEHELAELNALVSTLLGLARTQPERNPMRPEVYLQSLLQVLDQMQLPTKQRKLWTQPLAAALGGELAAVYRVQVVELRQQRVVAAGFGVVQGAAGGNGPAARGAGGYAPPPAPGVGLGPGHQGAMAVHRSLDPGVGGEPPAAGLSAPGLSAPNALGLEQAEAFIRGEASLTVDQLRRLLTGEFDAGSYEVRTNHVMPRGAGVGSAAAAGKGLLASEAAANNQPDDFVDTVPAAYEALEEMKQVEQVMQRYADRRLVTQLAGAQVVHQADGVPALRAQAVSGTGDVVSSGDRVQLGQALGLEVVTLMMESITHDARLLPALRETIKALEMPLLRLAMVDPRFFSARQHPARRLLDALTQRGMAYSFESDPAFESFMEPVMVLVRQLLEQPIHGAEPFQWVIDTLEKVWNEGEQAQSSARTEAEAALTAAEERNLLATQISRSLKGRSDIARAPAAVRDFICGPWAQVIAAARLENPGGESGPNGYQAMITDLLWSISAESTQGQYDRLVKMIPMLLDNLRAGLQSVGYPQERIALLLDLLIGYHHRALRPTEAEAVAEAPVDSTRAELEAELGRSVSAPWLVPKEAAKTTLLDIGDMVEAVANAASFDAVTHSEDVSPVEELAASQEQEEPSSPITVGTWVEFYTDGQWTRAELAWASPKGTMYMFSGPAGRNHSMTRRLLEKLMREGVIIEIADHGLVEAALDAVAEAALRNSVDLLL